MMQFMTNVDWNYVLVAALGSIMGGCFIHYSVSLRTVKDKAAMRSIAFLDLGLMLIMGITAFRLANPPRALHFASGFGPKVAVVVLLLGIVLAAIGAIGIDRRWHRSQKKAA